MIATTVVVSEAVRGRVSTSAHAGNNMPWLSADLGGGGYKDRQASYSAPGRQQQ